MSLKDQIQNRFFKTPTFKGLLNDFEKKEKVKVVPQKTLKELAKISQDKIELEAKIPETVKALVTDELSKAEMLRKNDAMRFRMPYGINDKKEPDRKPGADVPFSYLRRMAQIYPIARACINRRIRQLTMLEWHITTVDDVEGEEGYKSQIEYAEQYFKHPMGPRTRLSEMLTLMVNDLLTLDATSFEIQKTRGGDFMYLVPIDPTTIALRVTEQGATPEPPEPAYEQIINGKSITSFTTDEMIYEFMNSRSDSPYGRGPLESLLVQAEAALRGSLYNLDYLRVGGIPEGFVTLPEELAANKDMVEEWQLWFDLLVSGNTAVTHRLKILPFGAVYTPTKKPEDMAFEKFEMWLLQQTCAIFEVQPQDIGVTMNVNRATAHSQEEVSKERGLIPLGNFVKEIFDNILHNQLGFEGLQFEWRNIAPIDKKEEADIAQIQINMGAKSVDEYRIENGLEPLGLGAYVMTGSGPILVDDIVTRKFNVADSQAAGRAALEAGTQDSKANTDSKDAPKKDEANNKSKAIDDNDLDFQTKELIDLRKWKKAIYKDIELGRDLRIHFPSQWIKPEVHKEIEQRLEHVNSKFQAKILFDQFIDPELRASLTLLKFANNLKEAEKDATFISA